MSDYKKVHSETRYSRGVRPGRAHAFPLGNAVLGDTITIDASDVSFSANTQQNMRFSNTLFFVITDRGVFCEINRLPEFE